MSQGAEEKVKNWLENTGYPLEWRTAEAFRKIGFDNVELGRPYVDPITKAVRDVDVTALAVSGAMSCLLHSYFVVECKAATQPWALFIDDQTVMSPARMWSAMFKAEFGELGDIDLRVLARNAPLLRQPSNLAYGLRGMKEAEKGADLARTALMEVSSAARGVLTDVAPAAEPEGSQGASMNAERGRPAARVNAEHGRHGARVVAHPVIVSTAPLIACQLGRDGEINCWQVQQAAVMHRPHADLGFRIVHIVNEEALEPFIRDCQDTGRAAERKAKARSS